MTHRLVDFGDYRSYLKHIMATRQERNPAYSLRAYARDIGTSVSTLSGLLNEHHGLSRTRARQIAVKLNLGIEDQQLFCDLVDYKEGRTPEVRRAAFARIAKHKAQKSFTPLTVDVFKYISDWVHLALLELMNLDDFKADICWLARRLNVSKSRIKDAIQRLERLDVIEVQKGRMKFKMGDIEIGSSTPSIAIQTFHEQILKKATTALFDQPIDHREYSSVVIAINREDLPKIKQKIRSFHRDLSIELSAVPEKNALFALATQCFQLDRND